MNGNNSGEQASIGYRLLVAAVLLLTGVTVAQQIKIDEQRDQIKQVRAELQDKQRQYVQAVRTGADQTQKLRRTARRADRLEQRLADARAEHDRMADRLTDQRSRQRRVADYLADRFGLDDGRADVMAGHLVDAAARARRRYGVTLDATMLAAQISTESGFDEQARSSKGAQGLMQVMPFHVRRYDFLHRQADLLNPRLNVRAGAFVLAEALQRYDDPRMALRAYHGGPKAIEQPKQVTIAYVQTVMERWKRLA